MLSASWDVLCGLGEDAPRAGHGWGCWDFLFSNEQGVGLGLQPPPRQMLAASADGPVRSPRDPVLSQRGPPPGRLCSALGSPSPSSQAPAMGVRVTQSTSDIIRIKSLEGIFLSALCECTEFRCKSYFSYERSWSK